MSSNKSNNMYYYELIEKCVDSLYEKKCHAVYEHEYMSDEKLKTRCAVENVKGASCFNKDVNVAEKIADIIYDSSLVLPWAKNSTDDDLYICIEEEACGKKFLSKVHDWSNGALICDRIVVILGKKKDIAGCTTSIFVRTAYPM